MIIPVGHRVLVKTENYDEHDEVYKSAKTNIPGFTIVQDKHVRYQASVDEGTIVSCGKTAWKDFGGPWADVGDTVLFAKHAGKPVVDPEDKDTHYVLLNDEDIVAIVKE